MGRDQPAQNVPASAPAKRAANKPT
jgi:hypothetical protein